MVKLTNREASGFVSPVIVELFNSKDRRFPIKDAFRIAEMIQDIQKKFKIAQDQTRFIIESGGGKIHEDGRVEYKTFEDQKNATEKLEELDGIVVSIPGEKIEQKDSWPDLSVQEAYLLKPIIKFGDD